MERGGEMSFGEDKWGRRPCKDKGLSMAPASLGTGQLSAAPAARGSPRSPLPAPAEAAHSSVRAPRGCSQPHPRPWRQEPLQHRALGWAPCQLTRTIVTYRGSPGTAGAQLHCTPLTPAIAVGSRHTRHTAGGRRGCGVPHVSCPDGILRLFVSHGSGSTPLPPLIPANSCHKM